MARPSNQDVAARFRTLITDRARELLTPEQLEATKPWRNELWRAFREVEDRLDPLGALARERDGKQA